MVLQQGLPVSHDPMIALDDFVIFFLQHFSFLIVGSSYSVVEHLIIQVLNGSAEVMAAFAVDGEKTGLTAFIGFIRMRLVY